MNIWEGIQTTYKKPGWTDFHLRWCPGIVIQTSDDPGFCTYEFHPYGGQPPMPCARPAGGRTYPVTR